MQTGRQLIRPCDESQIISHLPSTCPVELFCSQSLQWPFLHSLCGRMINDATDANCSIPWLILTVPFLANDVPNREEEVWSFIYIHHNAIMRPSLSLPSLSNRNISFQIFSGLYYRDYAPGIVESARVILERNENDLRFGSVPCPLKAEKQWLFPHFSKCPHSLSNLNICARYLPIILMEVELNVHNKDRKRC